MKAYDGSTANFNSHTREGVTKAAEETGNKNENFNSHTREGVTCYPRLAGQSSKFQLTHP